MKRLTQGSALLLSALALASSAWAGPFTAEFNYDSSSVGNTITQVLTVKNTDGAGNTLDLFRIFLDADAANDYGNYSALAWINDQAGAGWTSDAIAPSGGFGGTPGEFNDFNVPGIADGATLGFSYQFDYTGLLTADLQLFSYEAYYGVCSDDQDLACTSRTDSGAGYWFSGLGTGKIAYNTPAGPGPGPGPGPSPAPEPVTLSLLGAGLLGLAIRRRRRA